MARAHEADTDESFDCTGTAYEILPKAGVGVTAGVYNPTANGVNYADVTSVTIPATKAVKIGTYAQTSCVVAPANALDKGVTWTSSDATKATVNASDGTVHGIATGTTTITATSDNNGSATDTMAVTVS